MEKVIHHPQYGEIVYSESAWNGKKNLTVNGVAAQAVSKKEFMFEGKKAAIEGNFFTGVRLCIEGERLEITPGTRWYEMVLAILPFAFLMVWGNSPSLCAIFPVMGGAIGGGLGGLALALSLVLMKKTRSPIFKLCIGLLTFALTVLVAYALAQAFLSLLR